MTTRIIGLIGSLRRGSFNASLLRAAIELAPADVVIEPVSIREIPLYDGDVEAEHGIPAYVASLKDRIAAAHGLILATPEYNNSIPGVLKNAVDWLTRPASDIARVFGGKPVALMGASPGAAGTAMSQAAWLPVLRTLGTQPFFGGRLQVGSASKVFDAEGRLTDEAVRARTAQFVASFAVFAHHANQASRS